MTTGSVESARRSRVLVVDDDPEFRAVVCAALEAGGLEPVEVGSGADALAFLAREQPAVVLLDLEMDDMDGWEVLGLASPEARRAVRFVVTTARPRPPLPAGVIYLRKPFTRAELLATLAPLAGPAAPAPPRTATPPRE